MSPEIKLIPYTESTREQSIGASSVLNELIGPAPKFYVNYFLESSSSYLLTDEGNTVAVGIISKPNRNNVFVLKHLVVKETERGQGYGRVMMGLIEKQALESSVSPGISMKLISRRNAVGFYEKLGYQKERTNLLFKIMRKRVSEHQDTDWNDL